ncbi:MAG: peptide MFS transporter [Candidatus Obscuribacterales bacterium]|nr:peptide MFS transporter [Candidatus Obscuribacterales bacterium]
MVNDIANTTVDLPESDLDLSGGLGGHPRGLTTLFFTELWERFSYYGMRAILVLYMVATPDQGGLGFPMSQAATIYGMYTMLVYMMSIPGGFIADRYLGGKLSVLIGGVIIALGHFSLAFPSLPIFFGGLALIILGTGLLKPNISSMVGGLYAAGDPRRDAGFSIFYMGINIGAGLSPIVCGFLAQSNEFKQWLSHMGLEPNSSWHWGFAAAGVGMCLGLIHLLWQKERLKNVGNKPQRRNKIHVQEQQTKEPLTADEWKRLGALGILFFFTMLFWAIYEQGGSSLNLFADRLSKNEIFGWQFPSSWYQSLQAVFVISFAPIFSWLWIKLGKHEPSSPAKFAYGLFFLGTGIALMVPASLLAVSGKVSPLWLTTVYMFEVIGELCLSPVGLSTVTKLAPTRIKSMTMGIWFLAASLGNMLAGYLGSFFDAENVNSLCTLYGGMAIAVFICLTILIVLTPTVRKLMVGVK